MKALSTLSITGVATLAFAQFAVALPKLSPGNAQMEATGGCVECLHNAVNNLGGENVQDQAKALLNSVVYHGQSVNQGNPIWRHIVLLRYMVSGKPFQCSGAILSDGMVVTEAHCLKGATEVAVEFRTPDGNLVKAVRAEKFESHKRYDGTSPANDLGLVKFAGGLPKSFQAAEVTEKIFTKGDKVLFAGYGKTETGSMGTLNMGEGSVVLENNGVVRVQGKGSTAGCNGDSGGPGFYEEDGRMKLFGVVSKGPVSVVPERLSLRQPRQTRHGFD